MPSIFDTSLDVNDQKCVVCLLLNNSGVHALLSIEGIKSTGESYLMIADFLPAGVTGEVGTLNLKAAIKNPSDEGKVRIREINPSDTCKSDICLAYGLNDAEMLSWQVDRYKVVDTLIPRIIKDQALPPRFELAGDRRLYAQGFNCVTWAEDVLKTINVAPNLSMSTKTIDKTIAIPEYHVKDTPYSSSLTSCTIF